ncbi:MAG: hypothetical protein RIB93_16510 [Coleofasciculus sp. D1-CHI-01]|uniref:hypothetical protein n=1 Tax=Coleofasciculus sp. D1-CHI-01 TaxID=3068482 RepID=UPI0032FF0850
MKKRHLAFQLGLGLAVGVAGILSMTTSSQAKPVLSDVTGNIITTSDIAGGAYAPGGGGQLVIGYRTSEIQEDVQDAACIVNERLAQQNLPGVGNDTSPIPSSVQENLDLVLTRTGNVNAGVNQIQNALVNAGANPTLAQNLATSLTRLTAGCTVEPDQFATVVEAYNALISASSFEFLREPPEELRAIRSVLAILLNAALASN